MTLLTKYLQLFWFQRHSGSYVKPLHTMFLHKQTLYPCHTAAEPMSSLTGKDRKCSDEIRLYFICWGFLKQKAWAEVAKALTGMKNWKERGNVNEKGVKRKRKTPVAFPPWCVTQLPHNALLTALQLLSKSLCSGNDSHALKQEKIQTSLCSKHFYTGG